ncbi:MAG TPA: HAMP domain-containing sensor histidine kinase [Acidimicrobiales bacterium]
MSRTGGWWNRLRGGGPGHQSDTQWAHAAKVALGATAVVGVIAVLLALAANLLIVRHLDQNVDGRLDRQLASASRSSVNPLGTIAGSQPGELDDAPTFVWLVRPNGSSTALIAGAPKLPAHHWSSGGVTLPTAGSPFRFDTTGVDGGWLVAGESVSKIGQDRDQLLIAEGVLGALLLAVTFVGSFVVGLRASAPIEQIRRRQAEFTADASHELRTPLSVIEAEVDLALSRQRSAAGYQDTLRRVASESGRLRSIVEDLLWLARADGSPPEGYTDQVADVAEVGATCLSRFRAVADSASVTLTNRIDPDRPHSIHADADAIDRLITVLLDNACRYASAEGGGGAVELGVEAGAGRVVLTVDDSGPGIPDDHRHLVFDRFHRADDTPGGTGLGLAIADAVVRNSGGTWSVGTSPLGGARMEVSWRQAPVTATLGPPQPVA